MVHLHCRDLNGNPHRTDPGWKKRWPASGYVRHRGGDLHRRRVNLTIEERGQPCTSSWVGSQQPECRLGESGYLGVTSPHQGCGVLRQRPSRDKKKIPETEVFETGLQINTVRELNDKFHFCKPILFLHLWCSAMAARCRLPRCRPCATVIQALEENSPTATTCGLHAGPPRGTGNGQDCAGYGRYRAHRL